MSNLLKKMARTGAAPFGFPLMDGEGAGGAGGFAPGRNAGGAPAGTCPESAEDTYRKRLLELERQGQEIEREAYVRGFAQGEKDGLEYGKKSVEAIRAQLARVLENLESLSGGIFRDYRGWLVGAGLKIARHIVRRELRISPEIVAETVREVLEEAEAESGLTVYMHPHDIEFLEKRAELVVSEAGKRLAMKPDATLERGGCRVESDTQLLDASLESRFAALEKYLDGETERRWSDNGQPEQN